LKNNPVQNLKSNPVQNLKNNPVQNLKNNPVQNLKAKNDDDWDPWGAPEPEKVLDTKKFDYNKLDLNKLSDFELQRHKQAMDVGY